MASVEKRYDGRHRIVLCWDGERRYHSSGKMPEREARPCLDRLEERLRFVDRGLLEVPPEAAIEVEDTHCSHVEQPINPPHRSCLVTIRFLPPSIFRSLCAPDPLIVLPTQRRLRAAPASPTRLAWLSRGC
jgi:hypothetical protein